MTFRSTLNLCEALAAGSQDVRSKRKALKQLDYKVHAMAVDLGCMYSLARVFTLALSAGLPVVVYFFVLWFGWWQEERLPLMGVSF